MDVFEIVLEIGYDRIMLGSMHHNTAAIENQKLINANISLQLA